MVSTILPQTKRPASVHPQGLQPPASNHQEPASLHQQTHISSCTSLYHRYLHIHEGRGLICISMDTANLHIHEGRDLICISMNIKKGWHTVADCVAV